MCQSHKYQKKFENFFFFERKQESEEKKNKKNLLATVNCFIGISKISMTMCILPYYAMMFTDKLLIFLKIPDVSIKAHYFELAGKN